MWNIKQFLIVGAVLAMILALTGCGSDPWTTRTGEAIAVDAGGGQQHGGHDAGSSGSADIIHVCVMHCGNNVCGSNGCGGTCGTCGSNEDCSAGQCVAAPAVNDCSKCSDFVPRCYPSGGGLAIKCHAFLNQCGADGKCVTASAVSDTCDDGNAATADTIKVIGATEWVPKDNLCIHTPIGGGGGQTGGGATTPGYDHTFCAWASVTAKGAYGGQINNNGSLEGMKDWTDKSDKVSEGGWYPVSTSGGGVKYCRGVTALAYAVRVLVQTSDGDFPGWIQTTTGKQYSMPLTIYASWDGGNQMSVNSSSTDCTGGTANKEACQYNKGTLLNKYGAVFPSPFKPWNN